ncbi:MULTISPECIES: hypothetical protein [Leuconostoc gelidum group]|uniref:Uncharacterized protein n=1 Tax=Leuconostoc gelidum subsp. gelidum TaxID=1607839 RepID=A0AB35FZI6_LEUGE|nr:MULTISPECIES: hypothetical protein [Leuconostoc gelidum group]MBZ5963572.1 hypothetical protein [Leuconostoc gelidum subsp. gelidum]MBZ5975586.1 hypothetical protein [Leuconostoc gelidum subsp. gelidum]MBZ5976246.1 hypothetical protein [Leuconostoc gelidum subsp. gelidum]MBZ5987029.1 hypothetical protein [Leuconostoc gelidum subsp. gelidum]MBZ5991321.1 hypothetical protein [Leuconostoc gelidum subsp. gelidum]
MKQKILLKLDQLENYIAQLQGFRNTYQSLLTVLASDRQNFVFKRDSPNFKNTLQMSMEIHRYIQSVQSTSLWDVLIFDKELDKQVQTLIETSTTLTFEYRDLTNLLNGRDVNSESHLDVINVC